jgi:hypothetical protein
MTVLLAPARKKFLNGLAPAYFLDGSCGKNLLPSLQTDYGSLTSLRNSVIIVEIAQSRDYSRKRTRPARVIAL